MDPFEEACNAAVKEETKIKLINASNLWNILTNNGKNPNDEALNAVLDTFQLTDVRTSYEIFRNVRSSYDEEGLRWALQIFVGNDWL